MVWDIDCFGANVDFRHALDDRDDDVPAGFEGDSIFTEHEFDTALVLVDLANAEYCEHDGEYDNSGHML